MFTEEICYKIEVEFLVLGTFLVLEHLSYYENIDQYLRRTKKFILFS